MKRWFLNRLKTIAEHNKYPEGAFTVKECNKINYWTPADLIAREVLNNCGGSAKGFLGISRAECLKCYDYMKSIKQELIDKDFINEKGYNNSNFPLWYNYNF